MKSRIMFGLIVLTLAPTAPAPAEALTPGALWHDAGVRPACHSCAGAPGGSYGGTVWGTDCLACGVKPGLFPPCPNPCQTTLLGELVYDVRNVVDGTLSAVFGCVFGHPCGCRGVCTCVAADCDPCVDGGDYWTGSVADPSIMGPVDQPLPPPDVYGDPFQDEPTPAPPAQPATPAVGRSLLPRATRASVPPRAARPTPAVAARRVSYEAPAAAPASETVGPRHQTTLAARPLPTNTAVATHYQPRRATSLRRANGQPLEQTPIRSNGVSPALRFRAPH